MRSFLVFLACLITLPTLAQVDEFKRDMKYSGQRLKVDAELVTNITVSPAADGQFHVLVSYILNDGKLNDAVQVQLKDGADEFLLQIDLDEKALKTKNTSDCEDENASWWGDEWGGRVCSDIQVEIQIPDGTAVDIESVLADVVLSGEYAELNIKTVTGNIDLTWPEKLGFLLDLKTTNGGVYTNYDLKTKSNEGLPLISAHKFDAEWGDGKHLLKLETVTSDIFFRKG